MAGRRLPIQRQVDALQEAVTRFLAEVATCDPDVLRDVVVRIEWGPNALDLAMSIDSVALWRIGQKGSRECVLLRHPIEYRAARFGLDAVVREVLTVALSATLGISPTRIDPSGVR